MSGSKSSGGAAGVRAAGLQMKMISGSAAASPLVIYRLSASPGDHPPRTCSSRSTAVLRYVSVSRCG
ncbi:hypothetical protein MTO96_003709 [Rhipicephalus appendiculatus]